MIDNHKRMNPVHLWSDPVDTQIRISPEIQIRILDHLSSRLDALAEVYDVYERTWLTLLRDDQRKMMRSGNWCTEC